MVGVTLAGGVTSLITVVSSWIVMFRGMVFVGMVLVVSMVVVVEGLRRRKVYLVACTPACFN